MCRALTLRTNKRGRKPTELFSYLKKQHSCLQGWDAGRKASQCQTAHTVLSNTCQSYHRVTLRIAFNKHSPPRTLSDVNRSAETDFENQAVVTAKLKAGKVVALKDPVMPTRDPFIQGSSVPLAAELKAEGDFPRKPRIFNRGSNQRSKTTLH